MGIFERKTVLNMSTNNNKKKDYSDSNFSDVYGFLLWIFIRIFGVLYLAWALSPDSYIQSHGVTYYPDRLWSISIPTYFCFSFWCLIIGYVGYNYHHTLKWNSIHCIKDGFGECPINAHKTDQKQMKEAIEINKLMNDKQALIQPPVPNTCDLDIVHVNKILFDNVDNSMLP